MKIVVTVKLVPDANAQKRIDPATKRLIRGTDCVLNPFDEYAIEAALQLKETIAESTVTIFSMIPEFEKDALRKALAMGADDAVILTDAALEGSDVSATAYAMARALGTIGFDLVLCGGLAEDGNTGAVPSALAQHLCVPALTNAAKIEISDGRVQVQRETDSGYQIVTGSLPMVMSVTMAVGEPRYPSLKGIMGAKKKTIAPLSCADLGIERAVGSDGAKTELVQVGSPSARAAGRVVTAEDGPSGAKVIFDFLKERKLV